MRDLYEKIVGFLESMEDIGKHINKSQEMYLKAIGQLRDGRGNLVNQAEKLKKLGVKSNKEIPSNLLAFDDEEEDEATDQKKLGQF
ncbi:MAG: DNA recombination protein RmuC [Saprospiraceae bacterium]|nr:DNA recombination protein RmuC [Saprospiraceae bacterium]